MPNQKEKTVESLGNPSFQTTHTPDSSCALQLPHTHSQSAALRSHLYIILRLCSLRGLAAPSTQRHGHRLTLTRFPGAHDLALLSGNSWTKEDIRKGDSDASTLQPSISISKVLRHSTQGAPRCLRSPPRLCGVQRAFQGHNARADAHGLEVRKSSTQHTPTANHTRPAALKVCHCWLKQTLLSQARSRERMSGAQKAQ